MESSARDIEAGILASFESMGVLNYNGVRRGEGVREHLERASDVRLANTLEFFTFYAGNAYRYYQEHRADFVALSEQAQLKLVQLSVISLVRFLKTKVVSYDLLIEEFAGLVPDDLALEMALMSIADPRALRLKFDSSERRVEILEFGARNVVVDEAQLTYVRPEHVILKRTLTEGLEAFRRDRIALARESLEYEAGKQLKDGDKGAVIDALVQANLAKMNDITGYQGGPAAAQDGGSSSSGTPGVAVPTARIMEEVNSRKRKVAE